MNIYVYGDQSEAVVRGCIEAVHEANIIQEVLACATDLAIAPLLRRKISPEELRFPRIGTLIFHPSLLPVHRGRDAIRWAFHNHERYSGATWFWADDGYDTGDICEQEVLLIQSGERPRRFYERAVIPCAIRMLRFILQDLQAGIVRRRPQLQENSTYEAPFSEMPRRVSW